MSWSDVCGNCGSQRADCDCGNWSIVRTIFTEDDKKTLSKNEAIKLLDDFGNYILDNIRLRDVGGTLKEGKAKNWLNKKLKTDLG